MPRPQVFCRLRPVLAGQQHASASSETKVVCRGEEYSFDRVLSSKSTQDDVYAAVADSLVREVLAGYSPSVIAYGQTGSGKTYTMTGAASDKGIVQRFFEEVFAAPCSDRRVVFSALEIYLGEVADLLNPAPDAPSLEIDSVPHVAARGVSRAQVSSAHEACCLLEAAMEARTVRATGKNRESSRSHALYTVEVTGKVGKKRFASRVIFGDLAGSERPTGAGASEAVATNLGLAALGRVIGALVEKARHVPYRESPLTRLLEPCLKNKARFVIAINPCEDLETREALGFGRRALSVEVAPSQNLKDDTKPPAVGDLEEQLRAALDRVENLEGEVEIVAKCPKCAAAAESEPTESASLPDQNELARVYFERWQELLERAVTAEMRLAETEAKYDRLVARVVAYNKSLAS